MRAVRYGSSAIGFLSAAPARVAEDVDVRRPEGQPLVTAVRAFAEELVVLCAGLIADRRGHLPHQRHIEGRGQADRLRKDRGLPCPCHAMQSLIPPVVGGHTQAFDCRRGVLHLRAFSSSVICADE